MTSHIYPYIMENKKCSKPPTSYCFHGCSTVTLWKAPFEHGWEWLLRRPGHLRQKPLCFAGEKKLKNKALVPKAWDPPNEIQKTWRRYVAYKQNSTEKELEVRLVYLHLSTRPNMKNHQMDVFALPTLKLPMHKDADASNKLISKLQYNEGIWFAT